jgi:hypothetical protein
MRNRTTTERFRGACVGATLLLFAFVPMARADDGKSLANVEGAADVTPGGIIYAGLGASAIGAQSPGLGFSMELSVEVQRFLFNAEFLGGNGVNSYGTAFLGGSIGMTLSGANNAPYLLGGAGYLARGLIGLPDNPSAGPEREYVVVSVEGGYVIGRSRRFGQVWLGLHGLVPVATTRAIGSAPDFPFAVFTARFLL